jgi:hypothetical protein
MNPPILHGDVCLLCFFPVSYWGDYVLFLRSAGRLYGRVVRMAPGMYKEVTLRLLPEASMMDVIRHGLSERIGDAPVYLEMMAVRPDRRTALARFTEQEKARIAVEMLSIGQEVTFIEEEG